MLVSSRSSPATVTTVPRVARVARVMMRRLSAAVYLVSVAALGAGARELDPAACAARFDVQRDKIIRTEESREMGARYLSELEVGARRECLRLCCETDTCDVFVFEEKSPGSCYLFNCGPPEDFRCKFTAHGNFSSGVLALSRRLAELQDQQRLSRHEQELANLRSVTSSTASTAAVAVARATPPPPPPPDHRLPDPPHTTPTGHCSRYQFECRRGGECIAVYNACDGVAQCADGSDEAPELGCPPSPPPPPPPPTTSRPPPPLIKQMQVAESGESSVGAGGASGAAEGELWPHRLAQAQPHRYNVATSGMANGGGGVGGGGGSHIFSHKGGLLQEGAFEPPAPPAPWPHRAWQQPGSGMESMMSGGGGGGGGGAWGGYSRLEWPEEPRRAWPVPQRPDPELAVYMPAKTMPELPMYSSEQQTLRDGPKKGFELLAPAPPAPPAPLAPFAPAAPPAPAAPAAPAVPPSFDPREDPKPPVENTTKKKALKENTVAGISKTATGAVSAGSSNGASGASGGTGASGASGSSGSSGASDTHVDHKLAVHDHFIADDHDGLSEHPPAAIFLLVLGTLMTAALGTLLGCRARAARRRRRAHPRYALDADYLVNGMYL